jgi:hypothetical protein
MSFALLPTLGVLLGIAALAIGLWIAQRLRVQHREVEVLSTLFWQAAIEETRARVFVRRFRHWLAWMLLVAIASLLWMLLAQPTSDPLDGTQHVVLVDWSVEAPERREADLQLAMERAGTLPTTAREIMAAGSELSTLLAAGEPLELTMLRAAELGEPSASGVQWAIESLSHRASREHPLVLHLVGDATLEKDDLDRLHPEVTVYRIARESIPTSTDLATLGVSDSRSGQWNTVDVAIGFDPDQPVDASSVRVFIDDQPLDRPIVQVADAGFQLLDVAAGGGILRVEIDGQSVGAMTLPRREPIRVQLDPDVPETLRELLALDAVCQIVESNPDVRIGAGADADLRLSTDDQPAFVIESDHPDPNAALGELINELALQQIDATSIAQQSGRIIDVQVTSSPQRKLAIWNSLFTPAFDFTESRACPILVARSIRWLANKPPMIPWAEQGNRLPVAAPEFQRASKSIAVTDDGREVQTVRLSRPIAAVAELEASPSAGLFARIGLMTWLGLLVSTLLAGEWMLYQRGRLP